jgi:hypothetical protein
MKIRSALLAVLLVVSPAFAQKAAKTKAATAASAAAPQKMDEEYTKLIKEYLNDSRITTELVDHMPASDTVPSPLKFLGRIPGKPDELTYAKDIYRYYEVLAKASPRAKFWKVGTTEEGRDQVVLAIADEATIKDLDKYKAQLAALNDPRKTTEEQAREIIHKTGKPLYWANSGIHSPETGGPEMLIELAYRLIIEETPFIQAIRNNMIVFITPVIEVDGREKEVDTWYYGKETGKQRPPLMYWGKYVQHDNNRDGMGQYLKITQNMMKGILEWHPTVFHDLHEAQSYLYVSTGTGPYNESLDPIAIDEWWLLGETEVMEMAKRGVPGVFTYGFYDGWVPNYLFWMALTHNTFGRFYEVQSYGPAVQERLQLQPTATSREWFRPNPPLPVIKWGPRNNTNIQESALLIALHKVATEKELYLENYWLKNKRQVQKGTDGPTFAWVMPAGQRAKENVADTVNALRTQGLEIHRATADFTAGKLKVAAGDYIVRADQPYRTLADMYFAVQNYPPANPRPYDDTGWTMQYLRNIKLSLATDKSILSAPMTLLTADAKAPGGIDGSGTTLLIDHTTDNVLMGFRFKNASVKMLAAEEDFEKNAHRFKAGTFIIPNADRALLDPQLKALGIMAMAVASVPEVKTHEMDVPRIGYIHSWSRTQDEGWTRAALDYYGVPYTYFADQKVKEGNLRAKYDVIIYPHVGGTPQSQVAGIPMTGEPIPYKKTKLTPNLGANDESDDIRGGLGIDGLAELSKFVQQGGTLIADGSTSAMLADYGVATGVTLEHPATLFARGSILRGTITDAKSPITYGFDQKDIPVYFNQEPVMAVAAAGGFGGFGGGGGRGAGSSEGQNVTPMAVPIHVAPLDPSEATEGMAASGGGGRRGGGAGAGGGRGGGGRGGAAAEGPRPRVVMQFGANANDLLLSGTLGGGDTIVNRALAVDVPVGKGHIVMFALRPFWRWQTQGTYFLAFNAILNWNDLDAGKAPVPSGGVVSTGPLQRAR